LIFFNGIFIGIGQGRITENLKDAPIDESLFIRDQDSVNMVLKNNLKSTKFSSLFRIGF
jgi:hypothetical protein